jgi:hypothetical protein
MPGVPGDSGHHLGVAGKAVLSAAGRRQCPPSIAAPWTIQARKIPPSARDIELTRSRRTGGPVTAEVRGWLAHAERGRRP